ncbi:MAG: flagellar motor protein MotB [Planctomycetota bacterium]
MAVEPAKPSKILVPQYMVSFGDMMTNILTFFILLCSFAKQQEAGLMHDGVGSFKDELGRAGVPSLTRAYDNLIEMFEQQLPYEIPKRAHLNEDAWEEVGMRLESTDFEAMSDVQLETLESMAEVSLNVPGEFAAGTAELSLEQKRQIDGLMPEIESSLLIAGRSEYLWIIEAQTDSAEAEDPKAALALSWRRALAAYRYLKERTALPASRFVPRGVAASFAPDEKRISGRPEDQRFLRGLKLRLESRPD